MFLIGKAVPSVNDAITTPAESGKQMESEIGFMHDMEIQNF